MCPRDIAATNSLLGRHDGKLYQDYDAYAFTGIADYNTDEVDLTAVTGYHHFVNYFLGDYDFTGSGQRRHVGLGAFGIPRLLRGDPRSDAAGVATELHGRGLLPEHPAELRPADHLPGALEDSRAPATLRYITVHKLSQTDGTTFAGFAQAIWKINADLEATVGARYTHEPRTRSSTSLTWSLPTDPCFRQNAPLADNQTFDNLSPEVTLTWHPAQNWTVYGAYKQGFKSGGFRSAPSTARSATPPSPTWPSSRKSPRASKAASRDAVRRHGAGLDRRLPLQAIPPADRLLRRQRRSVHHQERRLGHHQGHRIPGEWRSLRSRPA